MDIPPFEPPPQSQNDSVVSIPVASNPDSMNPVSISDPLISEATSTPSPTDENPPPPPPPPANRPPSSSTPRAKGPLQKKFLLIGAIFLAVSVFAITMLVRKGLFTTQREAAPSSCILQDSNIILVIDRSSSMTAKESDGRTKLEWAKASAKTLIDRIASMQGTSAKIGVVSFGAQGNDGTGKLGASYNSTLNIGLSSNWTQVKAAIDGVNHTTSGTCIECGLRIANNQLAAKALNRIVILLSDGKENHIWDGSTTSNASHAIAEANKGRSTGIVYYVLGYGIGSNIDQNALLVIAGKSSNYQYKPNAQEWPDAFLSIVDIICQQPTPTPSVTPTKTPTSTPTPTNIPSPTPTKVPSPTPTKTPTPTSTMTPTPSPTKTPTPIPTHTVTPVPSSTISPTPTVCISPVKVKNIKISCPLCQ